MYPYLAPLLVGGYPAESEPADGGLMVVGADADLRWAVRAAVGASADLRWSVRSAVGAAADLRWAVRGVVGAAADLRWAVRQAVGAAADIRWSVAAPAVAAVRVIRFPLVASTSARNTNPRVGDVGTAVQLTMFERDPVTAEVAAADISAATALALKFRKPDGTVVTKTAAFVTDGTDGLLQYVTQAGDLDAAGRWQVEGEITVPGGFFSTEIYRMKVERSY